MVRGCRILVINRGSWVGNAAYAEVAMRADRECAERRLRNRLNDEQRAVTGNRVRQANLKPNGVTQTTLQRDKPESVVAVQ